MTLTHDQVFIPPPSQSTQSLLESESRLLYVNAQKKVSDEKGYVDMSSGDQVDIEYVDMNCGKSYQRSKCLEVTVR